MFLKADADGDGKLSAQELISALQGQVATGTGTSAKSGGTTDSNLNSLPEGNAEGTTNETLSETPPTPATT